MSKPTTPEQERQMQEVIENARETIKKKEDMERWRKHCSEQGRLATPDEAFAAGWKAAFLHRMQDVMEAHTSFSCPNCRHTFHHAIPVIVSESKEDK